MGHCRRTTPRRCLCWARRRGSRRGPIGKRRCRRPKEATDQARQAAGRAAEAAKPYVDKGKEAARKAYDDGLRLAKELIEKSRSEGAPHKE